MPRDLPEAHHLQNLAQRLRLARRVFDELDPVHFDRITRLGTELVVNGMEVTPTDETITIEPPLLALK